MSSINSLGLLSVAVLWWGVSNRPLFPLTVEQFDYGTLDLSRGRRSIAITTFFYHFSYFYDFYFFFDVRSHWTLFFSPLTQKPVFILGIQAQATMIDVIVAVSSPQPESSSEPIRRGVIRLPYNWWSSRVKLWKWNFITFHAHCSSGWIWIIFQNIEYAWKKSRAPIPFVTYFFLFCNNNLFHSQTKPRS